MTDPAIDPRLLTAPHDPEVRRRTERLNALGLTNRPYPELDHFAARLAALAKTPYAMVNFIGEDHQYFAGLYAPSQSAATAVEAADVAAGGPVSRVMARDHGYCPHVVVRRKALILDDIHYYARFSGNPVVDRIGIQSYMGIPLIDETDTALGTICAVSTETSSWGRDGLDILKPMAEEVIAWIQRLRR